MGTKVTFFEIFLIALGLSADAFAVAMCYGVKIKSIKPKAILLIAFSFGFFQAIMPIIGYFVGIQFEAFISSIDHWVAFILLMYVGVKMFVEAFKKDEHDENDFTKIDIKTLLIMSIATSIDALAVGISFAMIKDISIFPSSITIGVITLVSSYIAVCIGKRFGEKFRKSAEVLGGLILIFIGVKVIVEHFLVV